MRCVAKVHHVDYEETVEDLESVAKRLISGLRPGLGPGVSGVSQTRSACPHGQPYSGSAAGL